MENSNLYYLIFGIQLKNDIPWTNDSVEDWYRFLNVANSIISHYGFIILYWCLKKNKCFKGEPP